LQTLAFGVLPNPNHSGTVPQPLMVTHEVTALPSATTLAVLRSGSSSPTQYEQTIAIVADPVFSPDDPRTQRPNASGPEPVTVASAQSKPRLNPRDLGLAGDAGIMDTELRIRRLPGTRQEATAIVSLLPPKQTTLWMDFKATREAVTALTPGKYRYLHFATHGLVNNTHPDLSGLIFSAVDREGKPQEAFLRVHDIATLKLPSELTVLSACQTALGRVTQGEGVVGLARGFLCAGSKRVVASLWSVNDASTAKLMTEFYRAMIKAKKSPAAALRQAQITMWKQNPKQNPYFWGGFVLQGEFR
jgi:CHAT domain-containing protein